LIYRFVERAISVEDGSNGFISMIGELDHADLDHLVGGGVQTGCFDVEQNSDLGWLS
jgi:hypothetical protein